MQTETIQEAGNQLNEQPSTIIEVAADQVPTQRTNAGMTEGLLAHSPTTCLSIASTRLTQLFGLDIRAAILAILVDLMVFTGEVATLGFLLPLAICVAAALGFITYKIQRHWYGDDHNSALIKSMIVGLLTAIPAPLTPLIAIPGGVVGIVKVIRRK